MSSFILIAIPLSDAGESCVYAWRYAKSPEDIVIHGLTHPEEIVLVVTEEALEETREVLLAALERGVSRDEVLMHYRNRRELRCAKAIHNNIVADYEQAQEDT